MEKYQFCAYQYTDKGISTSGLSEVEFRPEALEFFMELLKDNFDAEICHLAGCEGFNDSIADSKIFITKRKPVFSPKEKIKNNRALKRGHNDVKGDIDHTDVMEKCVKIANEVYEIQDADDVDWSSENSFLFTEEQRKEGTNTKPKPKRPTWEEVLEELPPFPTLEQENEDWVLSKNVNGVKTESLRAMRNAPEAEKKHLSDGGVLICDKSGRICWKLEADTQKVFYAVMYLPKHQRPKR